MGGLQAQSSLGGVCERAAVENPPLQGGCPGVNGLTGQQRALLINLAQEGIPLCERPFVELAEKLGADEPEVIAALAGRPGIRPGGAAQAPSSCARPGLLLHARRAEGPGGAPGSGCRGRLSAHRGVSHNYSRDHELSLWFTLPCRPEPTSRARRLRWPHPPEAGRGGLFQTLRHSTRSACGST